MISIKHLICKNILKIYKCNINKLVITLLVAENLMLKKRVTIGNNNFKFLFKINFFHIKMYKHYNKDYFKKLALPPTVNK
jgi:hypothetical protein